MGIFRNSLLKSPSIPFMPELGFEYKIAGGPKGETGWVKTISFCDDLYVLWITVDTENNTLWLYCEYDCGGELWSRESDIPEEAMVNKELFIDWIDAEIGDEPQI